MNKKIEKSQKIEKKCKNGFEVIVGKGLLIYVIDWSRNFENC